MSVQPRQWSVRYGLLIISLLFMARGGVADDTSGNIQRGEYLSYAGGCISCHTEDDAGEAGFLAGGVALETPFGTFYSPNITPANETGIGDWNDADFIRAMRYGFSPQGYHYYPAFPYTSYAGMTRQDLIDLKAYLFSLPAINKANTPHELTWFARYRFTLRGWKWLNHEPQEFKPDPAQSEQWNRGRYLVNHLGHCGECHTPRDLTGARKDEYYLAGNPDGPEGEAIPNITSDREDGIGTWTESDIITFLELGMLPDSDFAGSSMTAVIDDNTSKLTPEDRKAIAVYLKSIPPLADTDK